MTYMVNKYFKDHEPEGFKQTSDYHFNNMKAAETFMSNEVKGFRKPNSELHLVLYDDKGKMVKTQHVTVEITRSVNTWSCIK